MFDGGGYFQELLVILVVALLVFGPDKLPELGRRLGRAMREFRRASDDFRRTVETSFQLDEPPPASTGWANPPATTGTGPAASDREAGLSPTTRDEMPPAPIPPPTDPSAPDPGLGAPRPDEGVDPFWTTRGGRLLHRAGCGWRVRVAAAEWIPLETATDGGAQGLVPCPVCDPRAADRPACAPAEGTGDGAGAAVPTSGGGRGPWG